MTGSGLVGALLLLGGSAQGFDAVAYKTSVPIAESETSEEGLVTRNCHGLPAFVVVEVTDPGNVGAVSIGVLPRKKKTKDSPCAEEATERKLAGADGHFWGAAATWGFVKSADSFENIESFQVFDLETGKLVFEGSGDLEDFRVKTKPGVTSIHYRAQLDVDCALAVEGSEAGFCWKQVLEKNAVPATVKLAMPDCSMAIGNEVLVTAPARIADLRKPVKEWVVGAGADCVPAP